MIAYSAKGDGDNLKFLLTVDNKNQATKEGREALELIYYDNKSIWEGSIKINDQYKEMAGDGFIEVARKDLGKIESSLSPSEIMKSKTWRILARHPDEVPAEFAITDKYELDGKEVDLLTKYVNWIQNQTNDTKNMGVYLDSQGKEAKLRAWYVDWTGSRSFVVGRYDLDDVSGRFAGISSRAAEPSKKDSLNELETEILLSLKEGKSFEYNGILYVPVSDESIELKK